MKRQEVEKILRNHHAYVSGDNAFQQRSRLLQAVWRQEQNLPIGEYRGGKFGSRLKIENAETDLHNFLNDSVRTLVRSEVLEKETEKMYGRPRLFIDLLASQSLAFNLFAELKLNRELATRVFQSRLPESVSEVVGIEFEHNPGRNDEDAYTGDPDGFDVFVEYDNWESKRGFVGFVVRYHENMREPGARPAERYDEIAEKMGIFHEDRMEQLEVPPLIDIWRRHLLSGCMLSEDLGYSEGSLVFLHAAKNVPCQNAAREYVKCLADTATFQSWTLEEFLDETERAGAGDWTKAFRDRYTDFDKLFSLGLKPLGG